MRRAVALWIVAALPVAGFATGFEASRTQADRAFRAGWGAGVAVPAVPVPMEMREERGVEDPFREASLRQALSILPKRDDIIKEPGITLSGFTASGTPIGRMPIRKQLNRHRSLMRLQLGQQYYLVSVAVDASFNSYYLSFVNEADKSIQYVQVKQLKKLIGSGVRVRLKDGSKYRFSVSINLFDPVKNSTLRIRPLRGTKGKSYAVKTGKVLELIRKKSYVLRVGGRDYAVLYGTDVNPGTLRPAKSRSFLFVYEDGMDTKAWPVAETDFRVDQEIEIKLDRVVVRAVWGSDGHITFSR